MGIIVFFFLQGIFTGVVIGMGILAVTNGKSSDD